MTEEKAYELAWHVMRHLQHADAPKMPHYLVERMVEDIARLALNASQLAWRSDGEVRP